MNNSNTCDWAKKASICKFVIHLLLCMIFSSSVAYGEDKSNDDPHEALLSSSDFPSAKVCGKCHEQIYDEWSSSSHAYSAISPMFNKFEQKINELAPTIGTFCVRCHASVGTLLEEEGDEGKEPSEPRHVKIWDRSDVGKEGVTCVTCHRSKEKTGKVDGERNIEAGGVSSPIYGPFGGSGIKKVLKNKGDYNVVTKGRGRKIHAEGIKNEQLSKSEFCMSCHQVAVNLGIKLEVVWEQYRHSPAVKEGVTCQDCHMGKVPGKSSGYARGSVAKIGDKTIKMGRSGRKHANHAFYGPGYSIAHPGIFPFNLKSEENWSEEEWLTFDYRSEWGKTEFENKLASNPSSIKFPDEWEDRDDRETAREIIEENLEKLRKRDIQRRQIMSNASKVEGPFFVSKPQLDKSLSFSYKVKNINTGHNLPSGSLGAQPQLWLNVSLINPEGKNIWESGYVDSNGDVADIHSLDVAAGTIAYDDQLFNLQTKFLTTNVKGTDREMYLPVNFDVDPLPFLRPPAQPVSVMNHPPFVRMEGKSLAPLGSRLAKYKIPAKLIDKVGTYRLAVRLRSRTEPIYFMRFVGATSDMEQAMNEKMIDVHSYTVKFDVK